MKYLKLTLLICSHLFIESLLAQTVVKGVVTEKGRPEALPFVSIRFNGTQQGATTDFEGKYQVVSNTHSDTLIFTYVGYKTVKQKIKPGVSQVLNVEMEPDANQMNEVVIIAGENPALRIIRKAAENKSKTNQLSASCFSFDSYTKVDMAMDNISEKLKNSKVFKPLQSLFDTSAQIKNEEGKYILPVFISETFSKYYQSNTPPLSKEVILASDINGFMAQQGNVMLDLMGSSLLEFNFNQNWIRFLYKDFLSPIADNGSLYYKYTLMDSVILDGLKCYQIQLRLRRPEDLGFIGTIWITDSSFALKRIDVELSPSANVNFLDRLKIQQEMVQMPGGIWLPQRTRAVVDIAQATENSSSFVAKMYRANSNFTVNEVKPAIFYEALVVRDDDMLNRDSAYWDSVRTEPFTKTERQMINMIDSVKNVPVVKTYLDILQIIAEGYYVAGKIEIGPNVLLVGYNEVQHWRYRVGFRTNTDFSKKWFFNGHLAYGTYNQSWKYGMGVQRIINPKKWTIAGISYKNDYEIMGVTDATNTQLHASPSTNIFTALSFISSNARLNETRDVKGYFLIQPNRNWTFKTTVQHTYYNPVGSFVFAYKLEPNEVATPQNVSNDFEYAAATIEARYAFKEIMVSRGVERIRMQQSKFPAITALYSQGWKGILGSDFDFQKVQLNVQHHLNTGILGNADVSLTVGKVFGTLPYPLLEVPRGNATAFYSDYNFSLMNVYEFVADEYYSFRYIQHFEGLFFNSIPVISEWKLRNFAFVKSAHGSVSGPDRALFSPIDEQGRVFSPVYEFKNEPYVEVGYGIENILRFVQLGVVHRLTYLNHVNARKWGVNIGFALNF
ncbi:MAG: DUF5686 and carboxypeptidase regulatory-like domain-containing protein [Bacteroidia bacterium]|jgi:hypothetical protein|nr:DUF5686 and carboxypeptidase regulatory-like domain-containing protein [Bacteroidia bacterium]